ncbi:MAG TPA: hypothetical protein VIU12_13550 [Chryseolinea sp.]
MKTVHVLLFFLALAFCACEDSTVKHPGDEGSNPDASVAFGSFYGMCAGGQCVAFFKLEDSKLYEDTKDKYPKQAQPYEGTYEKQLDDTKYQLVKDVAVKIPAALYDETETVIGCPDCSDGGGLYIEVNTDNGKRYWYIDNNEGRIPEYLRAFVVEANEKINLLR